MSEKRFVWEVNSAYDESMLRDTKTDNVLAIDDCMNLLNSLSEENEQLKNSITDFLKEADIFSEKATEHDIQAYREIMRFDNKDAYYLACAIAKLKKENEHYKHQLQKLAKFEEWKNECGKIYN